MEFTAPELWKEKGMYFNYISHQIFYRVSEPAKTGGKPPLLLLHGFPTSSWDWHKLWPLLSEKFRLIAPDMMGFGFSDKPREYQYSILDQADMIELLLQKSKINKVHILAHDYGDTVAQELLARHQDRIQFREDGVLINSVTLLNGGLFPEVHHAKGLHKILSGPMGKYVAKFLSEKKFKDNMHAMFGNNYDVSEKELNAFWQIVNFNHGHRVIYKLLQYLNEKKSYRSRWVETLRKTEVPVRFIDGLQDSMFGKEMAKRYRELITDPDIVELSDSGHYPQIEQPEEVLKHFLVFHENMETV
ncbi:alpha/beta fold hydrolase [Chondrinema litorale]|uniref:alpha/beta fold hydrolase n=1 Tax=Chondrinema litorale TaxID=2994555 RepID=UPI0025434324|nr:alpha/beta hydrolase [Chondrinema litorale]UZR92462.1 alpha/beta hydrolase [Chondrinema litorale]